LDLSAISMHNSGRNLASQMQSYSSDPATTPQANALTRVKKRSANYARRATHNNLVDALPIHTPWL
jgi:hypothetical protein